MKKTFITLLLFTATCFATVSMATKLMVPLQVNYDDPSTPLGNNHKSMVDPPTVYIEDYTLSFEANHPEYLLSIRDEDGYVVYTTMVYSTETQVVLPTTLSGDYMIELAMGELLFTGWINL